MQVSLPLLARRQPCVLAQYLPLFWLILTCRITIFPHQTCPSSSFFIHASGFANGGGIAAFGAAIAPRTRAPCAQRLVVRNQVLLAIAD